MMVSPKIAGDLAEQQACQFLKTKGLTFIARNYRCQSGEIDLIMQDQNDLVFIEVRLRNNLQCGDPFDSITLTKQHKIIKAAMQFILKHHEYDDINCRFDVIGISKTTIKVSIDWIKDAFPADFY